MCVCIYIYTCVCTRIQLKSMYIYSRKHVNANTCVCVFVYMYLYAVLLLYLSQLGCCMILFLSWGVQGFAMMRLLKEGEHLTKIEKWALQNVYVCIYMIHMRVCVCVFACASSRGDDLFVRELVIYHVMNLQIRQALV